MWITVKGKFATEINNSVINRILNLYPEEKLSDRSTFKKAFLINSIELRALQLESDKILIPWQLFLLNESNYESQIQHIELQRKHKISRKLLAKRKGVGNITSKRIIDRLIRQQNFLTHQNSFPINPYPNSLCRKSVTNAVKHILSYFEIDRYKFWEYSKKEKALDYLIKKIELKNINISRGVLTNKLLPMHNVVGNNIYKNTSGFVIKDEQVPFIFLPSEINPEEVIGRQLYTLIYLLVIIGLNQYGYVLEKNFRAKALTTTRVEARLHAITSELLIPQSELIKYQDQKITVSLRDNLCQKLKVTPLALVTALKLRGIINDVEYEELKPAEFQPRQTKQKQRAPHVATSIKKFCGSHTYQAICFAIQSKSLANTQAQYLIFGAINKNGFRKFCGKIGL